MKRRMNRFGSIAIALLALALVAPSKPQEPAPKAKDEGVTVPFETLPSNHIVLKVKLNGKGPFEMIFDVGAPVTLLGNKAAEAGGVVDAKTPKLFLFGMRGEAEVKSLQVGDLKAKDLPVMVLDHPLLGALGKMLDRPIDGLIGYTFFARYKTTIDYQAHTIRFVPVKNEVRDLAKDLAERITNPSKAPRRRVLAPAGLWGLVVAPLADGPASGVLVKAVLDGSPAAAAGLQAGDILTTLDGRWTTTVADTFAAAAAVEPGRVVEVVVLREGKEKTLNVKPVDGL
ncbi:MAG TPA: PDZ domain-containing protein [Isosphaeraceae bacterium]|jgi:hypothetical protein|nr:PDZ domain-containing protein [Isosphaeraceae bacterium]